MLYTNCPNIARELSIKITETLYYRNISFWYFEKPQNRTHTLSFITELDYSTLPNEQELKQKWLRQRTANNFLELFFCFFFLFFILNFFSLLVLSLQHTNKSSEKKQKWNWISISNDWNYFNIWLYKNSILKLNTCWQFWILSFLFQIVIEIE